VAAMTPSAPVPAQASVSRLEPVRLGQMKVWAIRDGQISLEASLLKGIDPAEARRMLGGKDAAMTPVNAFLVRMPGRTVLVDTGIGKDPEEDSGHLVEQLSAAGVTPAEIDLILITHFHFDHIGGLLKADGTRAFPKARLRVPRSEHAFWFQDPSKLPERLRGRTPKLKAIFSAYETAGAFDTFEDGQDLGSGLRAVAAHGHTGGHTVYAFTSEGQELWCIGDLIHFGAVQFERPGTGISFDLDGEKAVKARQDFFQRAARSKAVLAGAHLPRLVRIEPKGAGYTAVPVP
jgi:glyoxylase-like metal-dependent hydrolase (beta-lactamase superfamily II)